MSRLTARPSGRIWLTALGIGLSVAALWIAVRNVDLAFVAERIANADVRYLLLTLAVASVQVWLRTVRWQLLLPLRPDGTRVEVRRLVPVLLIGYLGNVALPARLGEPIRAYLVSRRENLDVVTVLGTVVLERILDVVALAGFGLIVAISIGAPQWIIGAAALAAALGAVALLIAIVGLPTAVGALSRRFEPAATPSRWARTVPVRSSPTDRGPVHRGSRRTAQPSHAGRGRSALVPGMAA